MYWWYWWIFEYKLPIAEAAWPRGKDLFVKVKNRSKVGSRMAPEDWNEMFRKAWFDATATAERQEGCRRFDRRVPLGAPLCERLSCGPRSAISASLAKVAI